jgi:hypothetical protein
MIFPNLPTNLPLTTRGWKGRDKMHHQHAQFADRIKRIEAGGANTFATVYTGLQDVNTPKGKRISGVSHGAVAQDDMPRARSLLLAGLKSGLLKLVALGAGLLVFLNFSGI